MLDAKRLCIVDANEIVSRVGVVMFVVSPATLLSVAVYFSFPVIGPSAVEKYEVIVLKNIVFFALKVYSTFLQVVETRLQVDEGSRLPPLPYTLIACGLNSAILTPNWLNVFLSIL